MIAQEQQTLRAILLTNQASDSYSLPAYRLLSDLGHDVTPTDSTDQVFAMLQNDGADLLVVDADKPEQRAVVNRLGELPADQQPREVAIFSDSQDEAISSLAHKLSAARVHVLLKPLHMHRLLGVLRHFEAKAP
jgi:response regulator of citrate/malate metabolism